MPILAIDWTPCLIVPVCQPQVTMQRLSLLSFVACLVVAGCSQQRSSLSPDGTDALYSTLPPHPEGARLIDKALPSVKMLSSVGFYRQASFSSPGTWPADRPITDEIWRHADTETTFTESVVGTATIVQYSQSRIALLTGAHVVTFDDTLVTYFRDGDRNTGIKSFSVLTRQRNYAPEIPHATSLEILAKDDRLDVAILGQILETRDVVFPVIPVRPGKANDLAWGSFVYVLGYPVGFRMVSSGIVSQPNRDADSSFLTDVVFNRGMSGGAVLAARPGSRELEWVGILTSTSASTEYVLVPDESDLSRARVEGEPYEGDVFISRTQRIRYGVSMGVSMEAIRSLAQANRNSLLRRGYRLTILD